ncbi:unnamed protein product [Paramecium pentaurelia]|uniref:PPM-type phosphatase domain-containing protein n=1 Tax=Paramecium pentaurelia TaxID=43138 RepID=A0A8S1TDN3_9CILI|nr:unnamed protein product [Paramecium pentaurelia]
MGSGASIEQEQKHSKSPIQNNIFIDEGVGIEQSQLSRKWKTKMTMFKNLETKNFMESQFKNKSQKQSIQLEQRPSIVFSDDIDQISQSPSSSVKSSNMHISNQKKKTYTDSEEESDIEEKQLRNDRRSTKFQNFQSDDSLEERDDGTQIIKQRILQAEEAITSRKSSINSKTDQQFLTNFNINDITQTIHLVKQHLPHNYPVNQLYIRTIISEQKLLSGKDKLVKLACRQNIDEQQSEDSFKEDNQNDSKSEIQTDYSPEQLLNQIGIAITCKKGNKNETTPLSQDYLIYNDIYQKIFILTNGHGEFGEQISNLTYKLVFHYLIRTPKFYINPMRALETLFKKLQEKLKIYIEKKKLDDTHNILLSGCVITVIIQRDSKLFCAQIGDNRVYIQKEHIHNAKQIKNITQILPIHSPSDNIEKTRIFNSGGEVRKNHQGEEYVFVRGRLYPQLHVSRSIGDAIAHVIGVSSEPSFREYDITNQDVFLVLSTSPAFVYQVDDDIKNHLSGFSLSDIQSACESLYKQCKSSWILSEGVFEDMTIILLWLGQLKEPK